MKSFCRIIQAVLIVLVFPTNSDAQMNYINASGYDFCSGQTVTYSAVPATPGNTYDWYILDYSLWSISGTENRMSIASGPNISMISGTYGKAIMVGVDEYNVNGLAGYDQAPQITNDSPIQIPIYHDYNNCGFIAVPRHFEIFYHQSLPGRWAMWYKNGVATGWQYAHYDYPYNGSGTYQFKEVLSCGDTMYSDTITLNVVTPVITTSGATTFCQGDSVTITAAPGSYNVLNWQSSTGVVPNSAGKYSITIKTAGAYSLQYYSGNGGGQCYQLLQPVTVTVNSGAYITSADVGCTGDSILLTCTTAGSYQWKRNGTNITGATTQSIYVKQSGSYVVTTTGLVCNTSTAKQITFYPKATIAVTPTGPYYLCAGEATTLTAAGSNITSYQWLRNNTVMPGSNIAELTITKSGTYKCIVSNVIGCTKTSSSVQVNTPAATALPVTSLVLQPDSSGTDSYTTSEFGNFNTNYGTYPFIDVSNWYKYFRTADRGVIRFNLNQVPVGSPVTSATIRLYADTFAQAGTGVQHLLLKRFIQPWQENLITWNNEPDSSDFQYTSIATSSITSHAAFSASVTDQVRHWVEKPAENDGLLLILDEMVAPNVWLRLASGDNATISKRPKLTVNYAYAKIDTSGRLNLCTGGSVTFTTNAGYTTQWYKNNALIAGATGVSYTTNTAGNYYVVLSNAAGCSVTSAIRTVTVNAAPSTNIIPASPVTICAGSATVLTADSLPGYTYQWKRNGTNIAGATRRTYSSTQGGTYSVVINTVCGTTATGSVVCNVVSNPAATITAGGPTTFCSGQSVSLTANTYTGVSWQWRQNGVDILGAVSQVYYPYVTGSWTVKETANGCSKTSPAQSTNVNCRTGNFTFSSIDVNIIPQPLSNSADIILPEDYNATSIHFDLFDLNGQLIKSFKATGMITQLNREKLNPGLYLLRTVDGPAQVGMNKILIVN